MVGYCPSKIFNEPGSLSSISITNLTGELPGHNLVVNSGSSNNAVFVPTNIAASSLLHLWTSRLEYSLLINNREFLEFSKVSLPWRGAWGEVAIFPSAVSAHFN